MNKYKKKTYWQYAMYKGDEQIAFGTREEICKKTNIKRKTFEYYRSNAYAERLENRNEKNARRIIRVYD